METITISTPFSFLSSPPVPKPAPRPPPPSLPPKRKATTTTKPAKTLKKQNGIAKPKNSKSRNGVCVQEAVLSYLSNDKVPSMLPADTVYAGCLTCRAKRLKCDETKPSCQQCHTRSVTCGGYKKDFIWKPIEGTAFVNKPATAQSKRGTISFPPPGCGLVVTDPVILDTPPGLSDSPSPQPSNGISSTPSAEAEASSMHDSFFNAASPSPLNLPHNDRLPTFHFVDSPLFDMSTPTYMRELPRPRLATDQATSSLSSLFEDPPVAPPTTRTPLSGQFPRLRDLLLPGSELNARPGIVTRSPISLPIMAVEMSPKTGQSPLPTGMRPETMLDDDAEEVIREEAPQAEMWMVLRASPSSRSSTPSPRVPRDDPFNKIYRQPEMQAGSPEMLMLRFDKQTCGILSVKDGPTENPWRTLIWPLARDSPALYHAIASMTAFHTSKEKPALRVDGIKHMRRSVRSFATSIEKMRPDTALATTLVLAFSESWDQHISTGIEHLRGAKILVKKALVSHSKRNLSGDDLARLKFLCNTWVYMDVIARLTSDDEDESSNFDQLLGPLDLPMHQRNPYTEIDPVLGCAATLFPLIGKVANLCRKVREMETNSIAIISEAIDLKEAIKKWCSPPGILFEHPEDPTSEIQHGLQTAEAYRYATLLYLHQAVPEIPSLTSAQLAKKVLVYLATVPLSSRLVIVQIYPLLAAGCEAWEREDRKWVEGRWQSMANRMLIGNVDRCWEVVQEVWSRRDAFWKAKEEKENQRRPGCGTGTVNSDLGERKFHEELAMDDMSFFSEMLNSTWVNNGKSATKQRTSTSGRFPPLQRRIQQELVTEDMDAEFTVRGELHWVGVMKDWEWEIFLG